MSPTKEASFLQQRPLQKFIIINILKIKSHDCLVVTKISEEIKLIIGFSVGGKTGKWNRDYVKRNGRPVDKEQKRIKADRYDQRTLCIGA